MTASYQPSWMLVRLALETRIHHALADVDRLTLLEQTSPSRYRAYLATVYGFETAFEDNLCRTGGLDPKLFRSRLKHARLRADLLALGLTEADLRALPRCTTIPRFKTSAQALGWLYVVERNTLLHGLLRRHLASRMPEEIRHAGSYLSSYGDTPGARYRELGVVLDQLAHAPLIPGQIVTAANEAFRCQRQWFLSSVRPTTELGADEPARFVRSRGAELAACSPRGTRNGDIQGIARHRRGRSARSPRDRTERRGM